MYDTEMITLQPKVLGKLAEGLICRCAGVRGVTTVNFV